MLIYTLKRLGVALLVAVTVTILTFALLRLSGDPAVALPYFLGAALRVLRQAIQLRENLSQGGGAAPGERLLRGRQDRAPGSGLQGKARGEITRLKRAVAQGNPDLPFLQHLPEGRAQDGNENLLAEVCVGRLPIDVEKPGVRGGWAVLQHVAPPPVFGGGDAHVVGHDVQQNPHLAPPQPADEAPQHPFAPDLRIDPRIVHNVISVQAAGAGRGQRRCVEMGDAQLTQVAGALDGLPEGKTPVELKAVGGERDA